jgi:hypothetical protein
VTHARNGDDDGHFFVAVKVTDNGNGTWHYEYVVQNFDNARGGASLRLPLCPSTQLANASFRDVDQDALNDWTWSRVGAELVFQAPANNPLDWNTMFNFAFDCDEAPVTGDVAIDQARLGAGALAVVVPTQVPGGVAEIRALGAGCGAPAPGLAVVGMPLVPNPAFALDVTAQPLASTLLFVSAQQDNVLLTPACTQWIADASIVSFGLVVADGAGLARFAIPIPNDLAFDGVEIYWQAVEVQPAGPLYGEFAASNAVATRLGCR